MSDQERRCQYCWHPPPQHSNHPRLHNPGCPTKDPEDMVEWEKGRAWGFSDERNRIEWWQNRYYKRPYVLGWRVGNAELDGLIEEAAESRDYY